MSQRPLLASVTMAAVLSVGAAVQAEQFVAENGQVVHTRLAPVVVHKALPPFKGIHVYQRPANRSFSVASLVKRDEPRLRPAIDDIEVEPPFGKSIEPKLLDERQRLSDEALIYGRLRGR
jgi:hypothetical protein